MRNYCVASVLVLLLHVISCRCLAEINRDSIDWTKHGEFRTACELFWSNQKLDTSFRVSGTCLSSHPIPRGQLVTAEFSAECVNKKLRLKLRYNENRGIAIMDARRDILADGKQINVANFSPQRHPNGCELEIWEDTNSNFRLVTMAQQMDLRTIVRNPIIPSRDAIENLKFISVSPSEKGELAFRFEETTSNAKGYQMVFYVLPGVPNKLVRSEVFSKSGELALRRAVDWELLDGLPNLRSVTEWHYQQDGEVTEHSAVEISELKLGAAIDESQFRFEDNAGCGSRRVIDRRPGATNPVVYFDENTAAETKIQPPVADVAKSPESSTNAEPIPVSDVAMRPEPSQIAVPMNEQVKVERTHWTALLVVSVGSFIALILWLLRGPRSSTS